MSMLLMVKAMQCKIGNPARKLVLLKLADNANDDGVCFPSYQYIADQCEISRRSAINHIETLIEMGLVSKKERKNKDGSSSNLYQLHLDKSSENSALVVVKNLHHPSENVALGGSENSAPITSHSFEPVNEPNNIDRTAKSITSDKPDPFEFHFADFWHAGLAKNAKERAKVSFKRAYQKFNAETPISLANFTDMLIADIRQRLRLGQFGFDRLHPATYLNQARWRDELPPANASPLQNQTAWKQAHQDIQDTSGWSAGLTVDDGKGNVCQF